MVNGFGILTRTRRFFLILEVRSGSLLFQRLFVRFLQRKFIIKNGLCESKTDKDGGEKSAGL